MLGGKLSQLNDKVQEQKVQKKETMTNQQVSQAVMSESEVTKNRTWFVMMAKKAIGYVMWEKWMSHIKEQGGIHQ